MITMHVILGAEEILRDSGTVDVAFLVVGDPFGATTHSDLLIRAKEQGIQTKSIHNASIMNAIGCCGLQLYNFGKESPHMLNYAFNISFFMSSRYHFFQVKLCPFHFGLTIGSPRVSMTRLL